MTIAYYDIKQSMTLNPTLTVLTHLYDCENGVGSAARMLHSASPACEGLVAQSASQNGYRQPGQMNDMST